MKAIVIDNPSLLTVHPAAALFPMMDGAEFDELVADIRANGQRSPIVVHEGQLLDGRNRLKACEVADVRPIFNEWDERGSIVDWVFSVNLHRRHLTVSQRAILAARQIDLRAVETSERLGVDARQPADEPGRARTKAAEHANIAESTVRNAQVVLGKGVPELVAKVQAGGVSLNAAAHVATLPPEKQREVIREGKEVEKAKEIRKARVPGSPPPVLPRPPEPPPRQPMPTVNAEGDDEDQGDGEDQDPSAPYFAKPTIPRAIELSAFHLRHPNGTTRAEEAAKVDEVSTAASSALHALTWMLLDWDKRQVWDMDFTRLDAGEISKHLQIAATKLEVWADICHGRRKPPTRHGA